MISSGDSRKSQNRTLSDSLEIKKLAVLVLLDLSIAFDTIDHSILLDRLHNLVGLCGAVFNRFLSYLTDREFYVAMDQHSSNS